MAPLEDRCANLADDILVRCAWPGPDLKQGILEMLCCVLRSSLQRISNANARIRSECVGMWGSRD
jgi:hypothetical protein